MHRNARVDVVIAESEPAEPTLKVPVTPEHVDVAPDPRRRIVLVSRTKDRGAEDAAALGIEPVAIVTPRTPHAARGITADEIIWADDITAEERETLTPHITPTIIATEG